MQVQVHNFLSSFFSNIKLKPVSRDFHLFSEITSKKKESGNRLGIRIFQMSDGFYMSLRDEEHMDAGFWVDIMKNDIFLIFINGSRGNLASDDGAKNTHEYLSKKISPKEYMGK